MLKFFNKIINFKFADLFRNGSHLAVDFEMIDDVMSFEPDKTYTQVQLTEFLDSALKKISDKTSKIKERLHYEINYPHSKSGAKIPMDG